MEIPKNIKDQIWEYSRLNDITDLNTFMLKCLQQGFNIEKYGLTPFSTEQKKPEIIEKEVIKEIPVEVIKEVEKIVEVEKIIEVPIEKIVEVTTTDNELIDKLQKEIKELAEKKTQLELQLKKERQKLTELSNFGDETMVNLKQKIENLEIELELEKNRHYERPKKEIPTEDKPKKNGAGNVISWVSKSERDDENDIYGE